MAVKYISTSLLSLLALLSNSMSGDLVRASFNSVSNGVVRIDLERKLLHQYDNLQLEDRLDIDLTIDGPNLDSNSDLLIESDEMNYSQLRELQRRTTNKIAI
eukprot:UN25938